MSNTFATPSTARDSASAPRLRLTARGRRLVALLAFTPVLLGIGALAAQPAIAAVSASTDVSSLETVTVRSGETLWAIAEGITVDRDVRDVVADLQALNGLTGAHVEPGQLLVLPAAR